MLFTLANLFRADQMIEFIAAFREGRLDFQKKYSESLNPYAMRFITLILLFTPSSTLRVHRVVCTRQDPRIYF